MDTRKMAESSGSGDRYHSSLDVNRANILEVTTSLDAQKARADKLLKELSRLPNAVTEFDNYNTFKKDIDTKISGNKSNISQLKEFLKPYTYFTDSLEVTTINKSLDAQKARADKLLDELSRLPNADTEFDNYNTFKKDIDTKISGNKSNISQLKEFLKPYTYFTDSLEVTTINKSLNEQKEEITRPENASTSGNHTRGEITEVEYSNPVATQHPESARAHEIPEWRIDLRKAQISRWNRAMDFLNRRVGKDTRLHRPDRVKKIVSDINEELKDIRQALSSNNHSSNRTNAIIEQIVRDETTKIVKEIHDHYQQALHNYGRGDKDRANRREGEELLGKHCRDLQNIKERYLTGKILAVESGTSTLMKELTGDQKHSDEALGRTVKNEDASIQDRLHSIYAVFDGVGGHDGGDIASKTAKDYIKQNSDILSNDASLEEIKHNMKKLLIGANEAIKKEQDSSDYKRMATTASVVKITQDGKAVIGNIGDSRVYLLEQKSKSVKHLTLDDSVYTYNEIFNSKTDIELLLEHQRHIANIQTIEELPTSIPPEAFQFRNVLSQALGSRDIQPNIYTYQLLPGDRLIIMSDGIHDNLTDQEIACLLKNSDDTQEATKALVEKAKEVSKQGTSRSKPDDMTAIVVKL